MITAAIVRVLPLLLIAACAEPPGNAVGTAVQEPPTTAPADPVADAFENVLEAVVTEAGLVRYERLESGEWASALREVVDGYATARRPGEPAARIAFWCNAYNANVLAKVMAARREPDFRRVTDVEGFFDADQITVAGETLTLNDLENERIRPLGDARIHAALVCAAMSCPPLRLEPFRAGTLDEQLDAQCRRWVNDPTKFTVTGGRLALSEILKWYAADFEKPPFESARGFVRAYAAPSTALGRAAATETVPIAWLTYDWTLNLAP